MTTDKTPATLATVKHGGCVQLGGELPPMPPMGYEERGTGMGPHDVYYTPVAYTAEQMRDYARAALSAQPSPSGQGDDSDLMAELRDVEDYFEDVDPNPIHLATVRAAIEALAARQPVGEVSVKKEDANNYCLILRALGMEEEGDPVAEVKALIEARDRQPVGEISDAQIDARLNALYREMVDSGQHNGGMSGVAWDRAVFRMASKQPAQAVDLVPAAIPNTPEVRDILGRPNFWCSPWANILRKRGDVIPCKAEEEQAAVILFMLNHYLAHGAGWAEAAEAELQAIRYQVVRNG